MGTLSQRTRSSAVSRIPFTGAVRRCFQSQIDFILIVGSMIKGLQSETDISLPLQLVDEDVLGRSKFSIRELVLGICTNLFSLALVEMKILLREVYSRFTTTVAPDMDGSMKLDDQIISARPKGQTCKLIFTDI
jgi:hypothetical protein